MTLEMLFRGANLAILPFWGLLLFAPSWRWTRHLVHGPVVVLLLTPLYAYLLFGYAPAPEGAGMQTLYQVMVAFSVPHIVVAGWIHYLIFDLFVGAWEVRDARRRGIAHIYVMPCLIATLMVGPVGLLLYLLVRFISHRVVEYEETAGSLVRQDGAR